jgi:hypothetical protein
MMANLMWIISKRHIQRHTFCGWSKFCQLSRRWTPPINKGAIDAHLALHGGTCGNLRKRSSCHHLIGSTAAVPQPA